MAAARGGAAADPLRNARALLAPLLDLRDELREVIYTQHRFARARVVAARLLAAAEKTLPADSLVLAHALRWVVMARMLPADGEVDSYSARLAVWNAKPALTLEPSLRCASLLTKRASERTLFVLSPHEAVWMQDPALSLSVDTLLAVSALEALTYWPERRRGEMRNVLETALRTAVESFPHGYSATCSASSTAFRPDLSSGCFPMGVLMQWCLYPDVALLACTLFDETVLSGLRDKFVGPKFERMPSPDHLPPHLRFLLMDAAESAAPARAAYLATAAAATSASAAAAAAAELPAARERMAPLVECMLKSNAAAGKGRVIAQRTAAAALVELADASLPPDSLVLAHALHNLASALETPLELPTSIEDIKESLVAWRDDDPQLEPSRRCGAILAARCNANTLSVLRLDEEVWMCSKEIGMRSPYYTLVRCGLAAAMYWPHALRAPGAEGATLLAAAVRSLMHAYAHDFSLRLTRDPAIKIQLGDTTASLCGKLFDMLQLHGLIPLVRDAVNDEAALQALSSSLIKKFKSEPLFSGCEEQLASYVKLFSARAEALGQVQCAMPSCGATEPHPHAYKRCIRCKKARYCCREHQLEDWKRHKREDGCKTREAGEA